jgi:hypothetical protein
MKMRQDEQLREVRGRLVARGSELNERMHRVHADLARTREPLPRNSADAAIVLENATRCGRCERRG